MRFFSIRRRLLLLLLPLIAIFWVTVTLAVYYLARQQIISTNISQLTHLIQSVALLQADQVDIPWVHEFQTEDHLLAIQTAQGDTLIQTIADFPLPAKLSPGMHHLRYDLDDWILWVVPGQATNQFYIAGLELDETSESLGILVATSSIPLALILGLALLATIYAIRLGLRPLISLSNHLHQRRIDDLTPFETVSQAEELRPITNAIQTLLARVRSHLEREHQFIDDAAHEIRTPLTAIKAQCQAIDPDKLDADSLHHLKNITRAIDRTAHLASRLLDQAKASQPVPEISEKCDLVSVIQRVFADHYPLADQYQTQMSYHGPENYYLAINSDDISSILGNLIENALQYSCPKADITLTLSATSEQICLTVEDSGPGIPLDKRTDIFERFYRLPHRLPAISQQGDIAPAGTGLGLSITKSLCNRNRIGIDVINSPQLGGACFRLIFQYTTSPS